ncbi:hypothetical protein AM588_10001238 [Phytophthora nicotianae]|uniref:Uncharacterized protein n=1 Tax=Phytophthora nicotianae TaxID=4792 RepID=A0A0W8CKU0_PHYNI|nr:hypothetical protein AM588_10001238 [Phytophthora nicotianae]
MLPCTSGLVRRTIAEEEAQCAYNCHVLTEVTCMSLSASPETKDNKGIVALVQTVLDEMVYDVESCEHECELVKLRQQLAATESSLLEYQERESELIHEKQQVRVRSRTEGYAHQNNDLRMELAQLQEDHASKTTIIQDMVELLTDEKKELEAQIRSQRKILVREVKVLRAQNQQLIAEKDHYFTQLKQLKHALQHLEELS